jgi:hypothetical protein
MSIIYQNPKIFVPHIRFSNALWFVIEARPLEKVTLGGEYGAGSDISATFKLLAPPSIQETIAHSWETYESITTRIASKLQSGFRTTSETKSLLNVSLTDSAKNAADRGIIGTVNDIRGKVGQQKIPHTRVDSPLLYMNSQRREYNLTFQLVGIESPYDELVKPIQELMKFSSPSQKSANDIRIKPPHLFKLYTEPHKMVDIGEAALISVQPTWFEPYINGYPTRAELTLSFRELKPLFSDNIQSEGISDFALTPRSLLGSFEGARELVNVIDKVEENLDKFTDKVNVKFDNPVIDRFKNQMIERGKRKLKKATIGKAGDTVTDQFNRATTAITIF